MTPKGSKVPQTSWLQSLTPVRENDSSMNLAMLALSMVRLGRKLNDADLQHEGLAIYGKALEGLHNSLASGNLLLEDHTLASSMVLSIFEVSDWPLERRYADKMKGIGSLRR